MALSARARITGYGLLRRKRGYSFIRARADNRQR